MPIPVALILCALWPRWWPILLIAGALRAIAAYTVSVRVLKVNVNWLLLPVEDVIGFFFWIAGFFGNVIEWRGRRYRLYGDGRFELISEESDR